MKTVRSIHVPAGFTLFELMVTLALAAVIAAIAIPNMSVFLRNNRLTSAANDLLRSTQIARSEAIKRQQNVVLCASANPNAATPACSYSVFAGWIVFQDTNNNWSLDDGEPVIERHDVLDSSVHVRNDRDGILSYGASGFANPPGAKTPSTRIVVCDDRGNRQVGNDSTARALFFEASGRTRVSRLSTDVTAALSVTGSCP